MTFFVLGMAVLGVFVGSVLAWMAERETSRVAERKGSGTTEREVSRVTKREVCGKFPAAKIAGFLIFGGCAWRFGCTAELVKWLFLAAILLLVSLIDAARRIIPDRLLAAALAGRLVFLEGDPVCALPGLLLGACSVSVPLLFLVLAMDRVLGRKSMGGGDIKLLFVVGCYLTWQQMLVTLSAACVLGLLAGSAEEIRKRRKNADGIRRRRKNAEEIQRRKKRAEQDERGGVLPFGPCISAAAILTVLWGDRVIRWYVGS